MTLADWRALIDAYLDGRLSAEAFMRRFIEGWQMGAPLPRAIADLQTAVEAFEAEVDAAREEGAVNDDALRQAVVLARAGLNEDVAFIGNTFDRTRAREEMRRFQMQLNGCAGIGCVVGGAWFALSLLQIAFVSEYVQHALQLGAFPAAVIGFFLAFVPVVGNLIAFIDATEIKRWPTWIAALVFFAAPVVTYVSGWLSWLRRDRR